MELPLDSVLQPNNSYLDTNDTNYIKPYSEICEIEWPAYNSTDPFQIKL